MDSGHPDPKIDAVLQAGTMSDFVRSVSPCGGECDNCRQPLSQVVAALTLALNAPEDTPVQFSEAMRQVTGDVVEGEVVEA